MLKYGIPATSESVGNFSVDEACQLKEPPLLPHTEFYNSSLDHIDLMVEFYAWKCPSPR